MSKSEWSSWVQAIFSVIAILAAVGIALHQRAVELASRAVEARVAARVVALSALPLANMAVQRLHAVRAEIYDIEHRQRHFSNSLMVAEQIKWQEVSPKEDLMCLAAVIPVCVEHLVRGQTCLRHGIAVLNALPPIGEFNHEALRGSLKQRDDYLLEAEQRFQLASKGLSEFLESQ